MGDYLEKPPGFMHQPPKRPEPFVLPPPGDDEPECLNTDEEAKHQGGFNFAGMGLEALQAAFGHHAEEPEHEGNESPLEPLETGHSIYEIFEKLHEGKPLPNGAPLLIPEFMLHMHMFGESSDEDTSA